VYTTVASEAIGSSGSTNYTGTLAFKAGGARRTCFGVTFTDGTSTITIDYLGNGSGDGIGTVNFTTGAYNVTFDATTTGAVTAGYQWEDSSALGVTDLSKSATRLAGQGFSIRQDKGGDRIQTVIPYDGSYFSMKKNSVYQFTLDVEDVNPKNELIRSDIGIETERGAVATSAGIMFMNTSNPSDPEINILQRNPVGDNFITQPLFAHFDFSKYRYDKIVLTTWDRFLIVACRENTPSNDRLLMCDMRNQTVDPAPYGGSAFTKADGQLYMGDPIATTSYEMFTGFDDMGIKIINYWISKGEKYNTSALKKTKHYRYRGAIAPDQTIKVSISIDNGEFQQIGAILGSGDYVDYGSVYAVGSSFVGAEQVGGDDEETVFTFLMQIKVKLPKFRKRQIKFEATGFGYCMMQEIVDYDIWTYPDKLPRQYRSKQNVSIDGTQTNLPTPEF
jgi:hypothetical protein